MASSIPLVDSTQGNPRLKINEVFYSLQGESDRVGLPTVFVRLTGCPLRCQYCDTAYAFHDGEYLMLEELIDQVSQYQAKYVCVTGGEPLAQKNVHVLLSRLCDEGYDVSLETSGAIDVSTVDSRVVKILDLKTPDSEESEKNLWANLDYLNKEDQVKFVVCSRDDYDWVKALLSHEPKLKEAQILLSPSKEQLSPTLLANWIIADRLPVRFQMQLHKMLWGDVAGV